ncbi:hypothetical protein KAI87_05085 [Myxococcota bacterium]|nr:hypothetical protein [Myxococcota bacterium]
MQRASDLRSFLVVFLGALVLTTTALTTSSIAYAAEITDVADAADVIKLGAFQKEDPFDLYIDMTLLEFTREGGKITREPIERTGVQTGCTAANPRDCLPVDELKYGHNKTVTRINLQLGLTHDLALTGGIGWVLSDSLSFDYADGVTGATSSVDPTGGTQLFPHDFESKRSGMLPFHLGLKWAPLSDERDDSKPMWVLIFDWESPWSSDTYKPNHLSPPTSKNPGPVGDGVHRLTFGTALSKRIANFGLISIDPNIPRRGYVDPYFELLYSYPIPQRGHAVTANVESTSNPFGMAPSHIANLSIGMEIVPFEDLRHGRKVAIDLGLRSTFNSEGRHWSELSDPLGELNYTEQYINISGLVGVYIYAADFLRIKAGFTAGYTTEHFLTFEEVGEDKNGDNQVLRPEDDVLHPNDPDELNPYFCGNDASDICATTGTPSYDQIGYRFKDEEHTNLGGFISVMFTF